MFRFLNIEYFYLLGLIPVMILIYSLNKRWRKNAIASYGDPKLVAQLLPDLSKVKPILKQLIGITIITLLVIGLVNPQIGSKLKEVKREGIDVIIAIDLSRSMMAEDLQPNRLERAKQMISKLVSRLKNDRIGFIVFGAEAYVQLPLTLDYSAAKLFLSTVNIGIIPNQGTAIGSAIRRSYGAFGEENERNKALVIITDGENHEDDALQEAENAVSKGIIVHTVGLGSAKGGPIPVYQGGRKQGYEKDRDGGTIVTKLNETMLKQVASYGEGAYIRAGNTSSDLDRLFDEFNKLEKQEFDSKVFSDYEDRFQYFLFPALLLLILDLFLSDRKNKWLKSLNLFGESKKS
ncbi:MAG: VWA domain-containing protein [Flavobacteriales bacterium]|nr:VWA domain-containing protein [Flavobacteriales bacterium]